MLTTKLVSQTALTLAFALAPCTLTAQSDPVTTAARRMAHRSGQHLLDAAKAMPADKYGYRPTAGQMTFGELVLHVQGDNRTTCSAFSGLTPPEEAKPAVTDAKDKLIAALDRSVSFCDSAFAKVSDSQLGEPATWYGMKTTRALPLLGLLTDWSDHYGQQAMYLRLNGILPPTAGKD
jgi:uncharacterized damage-inducible protein DinB